MDLTELKAALDANHAATTSALEKLKAELVKAQVDAAEAKASLTEIEVKLNRPGAGGRDRSERQDLETRAFTSFVRRGDRLMGADEAKALRVSDDVSGGYLVPDQFQAEMLRNLVLFSPIRTAARVGAMSSSEVILPRRTGTLTAGWVAEIGTRPATNPSYGNVKLPAHEASCYVDVSNSLLEDSAFDIAAELSFDFAEEFGRLEGASFVNGDGVGKPLGFMNDPNIVAVPSGASTAVTADGLIDLYHALPGFYAQTGVWMMNRLTLGSIRKLKTGDGSYLVAIGGIENQPVTTLLGRPVVEAVDMPNVSAGAYPIAFGDFMQGYRILDRVNLAVLRDPYSVQTSGLVRFHARRRVAGGVTKAEAIRKLQIAAA